MISSGSMPATGQPTTLRVSSPHAPLVVMPTESSWAKIFRDILDAEPVHLDGLTGGDVREAVGVLVREV